MPRFNNKTAPGGISGLNIVQVVISSRSLNECLRDLRGCGSIRLKVCYLPYFLEYAASKGASVRLGSMVRLSSGEMAQYLYI